jgi:lysophospholipid acyltransferase (LPLAT)-like uncharacterized protein
VRGIAGALVGFVVRLWLATLRVRVVLDPALEAFADRPWILSFFHGTQFPLLAYPRRRRTVVMVSLSSDGALQTRALGVHGFDVVRGSSSRGGARGLAALVRRMRCVGGDAAFAVDGPRGPCGVVKGGAVAAARATGAVLVPMGAWVSRAHVFRRAWDRFILPLPFARVNVLLGAPVDPENDDASVCLERAIARANAEAA